MEGILGCENHELIDFLISGYDFLTKNTTYFGLLLHCLGKTNSCFMILKNIHQREYLTHIMHFIFLSVQTTSSTMDNASQSKIQGK